MGATKIERSKKVYQDRAITKPNLIIVCDEYNEIKEIDETELGITTIFSASLEAP